MTKGIHIVGASGAGTTTLGAALAKRLGARHLDTDSYYWQPTDPPFTSKRDPAERLVLIEQDIAAAEQWLLSGSLSGWGDALIPQFALVVFLHLDHNIRMARLEAREVQRHGARVAPGGDMHQGSQDFLDWARRYDTDPGTIRSLALHQRWLAAFPCPVLELDASAPVDQLCAQVLAHHGH